MSELPNDVSACIREDRGAYSQEMLGFSYPFQVAPAEWQRPKFLVDGIEELLRQSEPVRSRLSSFYRERATANAL
jgi:hypothetical protein